MQSNQCEILGIASHALMNWHSGLAAITRVWAVGPVAEGRGERRWWLSEEEKLLVQTYALMNTPRPTHFTILRQLEDSCTGRGAS